MSVLVIVPTHLSMGGERGVSPGSPGQGTVVGIASGEETGEGARPLPAGGGTRRTLLVAPTPPGSPALLPRPRGVGAVYGDTREKPCPGMITSRSEQVRLSSRTPRQGSGPFSEEDWPQTNNAHNRRLSPELSGILVNLHTERWRLWGLAPSPHNPNPGTMELSRGASPSPNWGCLRGTFR
jgi:hypothetical protein